MTNEPNKYKSLLVRSYSKEELDQERQLLLHVGMPAEMAKSLIRVAEGDDIYPSTLTAFQSSHLVDENKYLTGYGFDVARRILAILDGSFVQPGCVFSQATEAVLKEFNATRASHLMICRESGYRSAHIKLLRSLALYPGQVWIGLRVTYGGKTLADLLNKDLITAATFKYEQVYLTSIGELLLLNMMGIVNTPKKSKRFVCDKCEHEFPEGESDAVEFIVNNIALYLCGSCAREPGSEAWLNIYSLAYVGIQADLD